MLCSCEQLVQDRDPQSKYHFNGIEFPVSQLHMGFTTYRTADVGLGNWYQVDPKAEVMYGMSPYCSMNISPLTVIDPLGDIGIMGPGIIYALQALSATKTAFTVASAAVTITATASVASASSAAGTIAGTSLAVGTLATLPVSPISSYCATCGYGINNQLYDISTNNLTDYYQLEAESGKPTMNITDYGYWRPGIESLGFQRSFSITTFDDSAVLLSKLGGPNGIATSITTSAAPIPVAQIGKGLLYWGARAAGNTKAAKSSKWVYGGFKSSNKWANQLEKRGWTEKQIGEAIGKGKSFNAVNNVNKANGATRFVHPKTGQSVVIDDVTRELLHVGGPGFKY